MSDREREEGTQLQLDFSKLRKIASSQQEVIPVVVQDADSMEVLIVAYVNQIALETAMREKKATFWSTSRNELWIKGKTSGDLLQLVEIRVNCEQNSLVYRVRRVGEGACHTVDSQGRKRGSCYYRRIRPDGSLEFLEEGK
ncbi:MAG: phosphoribosyl-AMP cyclohydrolase [Deltaproteobacteria bacterium]|nr:phosphoribosyl-AMP cyclohydrolase [Deltaproteobacteria bacterium]